MNRWLTWMGAAAGVVALFVLLWPRASGDSRTADSPAMPKVVTSAATASGVVASASSAPSLEGGTALFEAEILMAATPIGPDRRALAGASPVLDSARISRPVPAVFVAFDGWLERYARADAAARLSLLGEGKELARARREAWPEFARADPESAILLSPSASQRALLPEEITSRLEAIVAGVGFYGVRAICSHEAGATGHGAGCAIDYQAYVDGRGYAASIYGSRRERRTEEDASLYGVALDGLLALHADDVVLRPVGRDGADGFELIHRGTTTLVPDRAALPARLAALFTP